MFESIVVCRRTNCRVVLISLANKSNWWWCCYCMCKSHRRLDGNRGGWCLEWIWGRESWGIIQDYYCVCVRMIKWIGRLIQDSNSLPSWISLPVHCIPLLWFFLFLLPFKHSHPIIMWLSPYGSYKISNSSSTYVSEWLDMNFHAWGRKIPTIYVTTFKCVYNLPVNLFDVHW